MFYYENTVKLVFQPPDLVLIGSLHNLDMPYIVVKNVEFMVFVRHLLIDPWRLIRVSLDDMFLVQ